MPDPIVPAAAVPSVIAAPAASAPAKTGTPAPVVTGAPTPAAAASKPGVSPAPAQGGQTVPLPELLEERGKRQQYEKQVSDLQMQMKALREVAGQNVLFDINGNPVAPQQQFHQQAQQPNQHAIEMEKLWETDPRKAVQAELMQAIMWYDGVNAEIDRQEGALATKYADFNEYRQDVRQYVRQLPPDQRARPGIIELAYYAVRGQKMDNVVERTRKEMEAQYAARMAAGDFGLPAGMISNPSAPVGQVVLTDQQRSAAAAMGVPEAEYARWIKT